MPETAVSSLCIYKGTARERGNRHHRARVVPPVLLVTNLITATSGSGLMTEVRYCASSVFVPTKTQN